MMSYVYIYNKKVICTYCSADPVLGVVFLYVCVSFYAASGSTSPPAPEIGVSLPDHDNGWIQRFKP